MPLRGIYQQLFHTHYTQPKEFVRFHRMVVHFKQQFSSIWRQVTKKYSNYTFSILWKFLDGFIMIDTKFFSIKISSTNFSTDTYNRKCSSQKGEFVFFCTDVWFFWGGSSISTIQKGSTQPWEVPSCAARTTFTKSRFSPGDCPKFTVRLFGVDVYAFVWKIVYTK